MDVAHPGDLVPLRTQLFGLGVLGEYLGRIFEETKERPMFIVDTALNLSTRAIAGRGVADSRAAGCLWRACSAYRQ
jgi:hypothetical protein